MISLRSICGGEKETKWIPFKTKIGPTCMMMLNIIPGAEINWDDRVNMHIF